MPSIPWYLRPAKDDDGLTFGSLDFDLPKFESEKLDEAARIIFEPLACQMSLFGFFINLDCTVSRWPRVVIYDRSQQQPRTSIDAVPLLLAIDLLSSSRFRIENHRTSDLTVASKGCAVSPSWLLRFMADYAARRPNAPYLAVDGIPLPTLSRERRFYVYQHTFFDGSIYIWKGTRDRASAMNSQERSGSWNKAAKDFGPPTVEILRDELTEQEAYLEESNIIRHNKLHYAKLININSGGELLPNDQIPGGSFSPIAIFSDPKLMRIVSLVRTSKHETIELVPRSTVAWAARVTDLSCAEILSLVEGKKQEVFGWKPLPIDVSNAITAEAMIAKVAKHDVLDWPAFAGHTPVRLDAASLSQFAKTQLIGDGR